MNFVLRCMKPIAASLALLALLLTTAARADVFVLSTGGQLVGELVNRDETPRRQYVIALPDGAQVTLDRAQVQKVLRPRPEELEYERIRPTYADTAEEQWKLAAWCRDKGLKTQRETHLRRVIELEPDHAEARRILGYSKENGQWATRDEIMTGRGYKKYRGQWKLPQEIELDESKRKLQAQQQEWMQKIKRWRSWLDGDRHDQAVENIRDIGDPMAAKALTLGLRDEPKPATRLLFVDALAKIDNFDAEHALAIAAISDRVEEVRLTCLDRLQTKKRPDVVNYFVGKLKDKDNIVVNLAGFALGRMKDPSAIGPLIDGLVTRHKFKIVKPGGEGSTSATFGAGPGGRPAGGGMSAGGGPTYVYQNIPNQAVLDALVALTGQNFNFDKQAWKYWHSAQKKPPPALDGRRG